MTLSCFETSASDSAVGAVEIEDGDRLAARDFAAQGQVCDVDVVLAEDGPHEADQAGGIDMVVHQQVAIEIRIEVEVAELHQSQELIAEDRAGGGELPASVTMVALTSVEKSPRSDDDDSVISMPRSRASISALTMFTPLSSAEAMKPDVNAAVISFVFSWPRRRGTAAERIGLATTSSVG